MSRPFTLACALLLGACTLHQEPLPEGAPPPPPATAQEVEALRQDLAALRQAFFTLEGQVDSLVPWTIRIARLETLLTSPTPKKGKGPRPGQGSSPVQLVAHAQREARVQPSERGYWAKSAEHVYTWQPGRIFTGYLTWNHQTVISLPPGEVVAAGMMLDDSEYDVVTKQVGVQELAHSVISIRPKIEKGEAQCAVVTKSGRRYLFHFITGQTGMLAMTFETPQITHEGSQEPKLILPRPAQ
jgi:hypothetical protein